MATLSQVLPQSYGGLTVAQIVASGNGQDTEIKGSVAQSSSTYHQVSNCNQYAEFWYMCVFVQAWIFLMQFDEIREENFLKRMRYSDNEWNLSLI